MLNKQRGVRILFFIVKVDVGWQYCLKQYIEWGIEYIFEDNKNKLNYLKEKEKNIWKEGKIKFYLIL